MIELALEATIGTLILYALLRRRWSWMEHLIPLFFWLLIPILIGLNTPNPNWVKLIVVAVP